MSEQFEQPVVLVVDDSKTLLHFVEESLSKAGMEVVTTDNPITVATLIRRHRPQIMLVDVEMPGLEGPKVVEIIGDTGGMQVFLYSSKPAAELFKLARSSGATGYITKDRDGEALARRLWEELERSEER